MASSLFTGASRYSADFSAVIERSVGIASLSLTQMQQSRTRSADEINALKLIEAKVIALQGTLNGIEQSVGASAWQATSSDSAGVRVSSSDGVAAGSYTVQVSSLGSYSTAVGNTSVADPASGNFVAPGTTTLTLRITDHDNGGSYTDTTIDLTGTTLQSVVDAINTNTGAGVQAAIVNVSNTSTPSYTISLQGKSLGKLALQLKTGTDDLMDVNESDVSDPSLGAKAAFTLNKVPLTSSSRTITVAPGLTAELLKADAKDITLKVERGTSTFNTAVETFISSYNSILDEIDKYTASGGVLAGNSLAASVRAQLRSAVTAVMPTGEFTTLARIGIEFSKEGRLTFNKTLFESETKDKFSSLQSLIGTSKTSGFMKVATDALSALETSTGGLLKSSISSLDEALTAEDLRIEAETRRVEEFTKDLQERLAKADSMIAQLEQQAEYFNSMFEAMRINQQSMS